MEIAKDEALPLGLRAEDLPNVEVFLNYLSPKTGMGRQELTIRGDGTVVLLRTMAHNKPEELVEATVPTALIVRLLGVIETEGFMALDDAYPAQRSGGRYNFRVTLPSGVKQVMVELELPKHHPPTPFSRAFGAAKLVAALATPDALHHRFLKTL